MDAVEIGRIQALRGGADPRQAEQALRDYLRQHPDDVVALRFLAEILGTTGRPAPAAELWQQLSMLLPGDAAVKRHLGNSLLAAAKVSESVEALRGAVRLEPDNARGHQNLGLALMRSRQFPAARACLQTALSLDPNYALAAFNLGVLHELLGDPAAADVHYRLALALDSHLTQARERLGLLHSEFDPSKAKLEGDRALENHANQLMDSQRFVEAALLLTRLIERGSPLPYLEGTRFYCRLQAADWSSYEATCAELARQVQGGHAAALPFPFLAHSTSARLQLLSAQTFAKQVPRATRTSARAAQSRRVHAAGGRIRLAYLSSDFHDHATAYLIAGVLEHHDRARFEVSLWSYGPESQGAMRKRLVASAAEFIDVRRDSDAAVASRLCEKGVQVLIDLKGYTHGARPGILAQRPAPVQVSYLGYPGTTGVEFIDYIIADRHVIPPADRTYYSERVIELPHCYQPNDDRRAFPAPSPRSVHGLPERGFVFCCFNQTFKISPSMFDAWMAVLRAVPDSVLWLYRSNDAAVTRLRAHAAAAGVSPDRLVFAGRVALEHHLARYPCADLFLDTAPYNAHTTASDALWMGLPVLTRTGTTFAGRVATSLLNAVGLPELAVATMDDYVREACRLAGPPALLTHYRTRLTDVRSRAPLFDTALYTRHLENALFAVHARAEAGQPPAALVVGPGFETTQS